MTFRIDAIIVVELMDLLTAADGVLAATGAAVVLGITGTILVVEVPPRPRRPRALRARLNAAAVWEA